VNALLIVTTEQLSSALFLWGSESHCTDIWSHSSTCQTNIRYITSCDKALQQMLVWEGLVTRLYM